MLCDLTCTRPPPAARMVAIGHGYVAFARSFPSLFLLMFRGERLDPSRPALRAAVGASTRVLSGSVAGTRGRKGDATLTLPQAARVVGACRWRTGLPCCSSTVA